MSKSRFVWGIPILNVFSIITLSTNYLGPGAKLELQVLIHLGETLRTDFGV